MAGFLVASAAMNIAQAASPIACHDLASKRASHFARCESPDTVAHLPGMAGQTALTVSNFGLIVPGAAPGKVDYVCDDVFDRSEPGRIRRSPSGTIFVPSVKGLLSSAEGCTFSPGPSNLAPHQILNVAIDEKKPNTVYALGGAPRVLWRSNDAGKTFAVHHTFAANLLLDGLVLPPGRTGEIYVFGRADTISSPLWVSKDDGATFTMRDPLRGATTPPSAGLDYVAVDPVNPDILYYTVVRTEGDEIWRSSDGGVTATRILRLTDNEALAGFAIGATSNVLYVAGKAVLLDVGRPPGRLYVSRDGGVTWAPPILSTADGPHYNCLTYDAGQLFACGTNRGAKSDPILSVSVDEGRTWQTVTRLGDITGPKACVAEACQDVARWLCEIYTQCSEGLSPPDAAPPRDAPGDRGRSDAGFGIDESDDGGCGCRVGGEASPPAGPLLLMMAAIAVALGARGGRRFRR